MPTLTDKDKALLAIDVLDVLPDTATILRASTTSDGAGGRTLSWATVGTARCRMMESGGPGKDETLVADHMRDKQFYILAFPVDTDVRITDRVQVLDLLLSIEGVSLPKSIIVELTVMATRAAA